MSFENKGFKNDLNEAYHDMNQNHSEYYETIPLLTPKITNLNPIPLKTYTPSETLTTIRLPKQTGAEIGTGLAPINQPSFIKTDLPEFVITATKKKKSYKMWYIIGAVVLLILIVLYLRKKS